MERRAVIFDCDGVLVDSERLTARVLRAMAAELGVEFRSDEALEFIRGRKVAEWVEQLGHRIGRPLGDTFVAEFRRRCSASYDRELRPIPGIEDVLAGLRFPFCTASSSPREKIVQTLGVTGLLHHFTDRIHSAYEIGAWKPDPTLFLHAAADLGVWPGSCAVIEDSVVGVRAGVAAGMTVFGYAGDGGDDALAAAGAIPFDSMTRLPALLDEWAAGRVPHNRCHLV